VTKQKKVLSKGHLKKEEEGSAAGEAGRAGGAGSRFIFVNGLELDRTVGGGSEEKNRF